MRKWTLKSTTLKNSKSHCIISYSIQITLHYFQCRISALRLVRSDLSLVILKTRTCLLSLPFLNIQLFWFPAGQGLKKNDVCTFLKGDKNLNVSEKTIDQNISFTISFKRRMYSTFSFVKNFSRFISVMVLT